MLKVIGGIVEKFLDIIKLYPEHDAKIKKKIKKLADKISTQ